MTTSTRGDIVAHVTTVHPSVDARIFSKECQTLADAGYRVVLLAPADRDEWRGSVRLMALPRYDGRIKRMSLGNLAALRRCLASKARLFHFHDPELLPCLVALKVLGRIVVMDVHEDLPLQMQSKRWLAPWIRKPLGRLAKSWEWLIGVVADRVVVATPDIHAHPRGGQATVIQNFPRPDEFDAGKSHEYPRREPTVVYVGGISVDRGAMLMVEAIDQVPATLGARLILAGSVESHDLLDKMSSSPGWSRAEYVGWLGRREVAELLSDSRVGLVVLRPIPNYLDSQPTKLFEYMMAGLPVVASDFPRWRAIVTGAGCGILVDPTSPTELASAIRWVLEHPDEAQAMGERGREAVLSSYSWYPEGERLVQMYDTVLGHGDATT